MKNEQVAYSFDKESLKKIGKGMAIAIGGAVITYLAETIPSIDFGVYTPLVVALSAILINSAKEYLAGK